MRKVNLFVVGAMKAGTTAFTDMLAQHPDIYFSPVKEPHYFVQNLPKSMYSPSRFFSLNDYLENKFPEPLHIAHLQTEAQYQKIFSAAPKDKKYLAEGSTGYLHAPESAELIHAYNPEAKIIILVRDPLKRAFSHYEMNAGLGRETRSFEDAIQNDLQKYHEEGYDPWSYLGMSLYKDNIDRFKKYFGDNVMVIDLKEYPADPQNFIKKITDFLHLPKVSLTLERKNESRSIKNKNLQKWLFQSGVRDVLRRFIPSSLRQALFMQVSKSKEDIQISDELKLKWHCIADKDTGVN